MEFVKIKDLSKAKDVLALYENSFPVEERCEFLRLFSGVYKKFLLYGIYDKDQLIAFAHFNETPQFIHINYFAVDKKQRNKGYGSCILSCLKCMFPSKPFVVDVELPDENAKNNFQRIKRIKFYEKNQFKLSTYVFKWAGSLMSPMYYGTTDVSLFMKYIKKIIPSITGIKNL